MQRLLLTTLFLGVVGIGGHGQTQEPPVRQAEPVSTALTARVAAEPVPAPATEPEWKRAERERRLSDPWNVQEETAKAGAQYEASRERMRAAYEQVIRDFERVQVRNTFEAGMRNSIRANSLLNFLIELRKLGEKIIADEAAFKASFEQFQVVSANAAQHYQDCAEIFRRYAASAEFPETKATYQKAADWYDARAKQATAEMNLELMTDYPSEQRRLKEFVQSLRVLEESVRRDPALFRGQTGGYPELASFESYYLKLGMALQLHFPRFP